MERLAGSSAGIGQRLGEPLGDVVGMYVMDGLQAKVGQGQLVAAGQPVEDFEV